MTTLLLIIIYLTFISLGLPDAMLGSAWPVMYNQLQVPVSYAGILSMIIACGTICSSLMSNRLTFRFGPGKIAACSCGLTAIALFGFSFSGSYWMLCLWAIPYGLGAGSIDASMNNYVALHYSSRHMSWLHCMWGLGTIIGPSIMSAILTNGLSWNRGYQSIGIIQAVLTIVIIISLPLWKKRPDVETKSSNNKPLSIKDTLQIKGAKEILFLFFCYCALEQTALLWSSTYMNLSKNIDPISSAKFAALFCIGITAGRAICGFLTIKLSDNKMIILGLTIITSAIIMLLIPTSQHLITIIGLIFVGLGCAPIYPCVIHSTPVHFGADKSQAIIGLEMAFAYTGTLTMPPLFGWLSKRISSDLFPYYLLLFLLLMIYSFYKLNEKTKKDDRT